MEKCTSSGRKIKVPARYRDGGVADARCQRQSVSLTNNIFKSNLSLHILSYCYVTSMIIQYRWEDYYIYICSSTLATPNTCLRERSLNDRGRGGLSEA